jgi:lipopolysaccharide/colanic/teichoic acid biosynthesis glycosyltransferase
MLNVTESLINEKIKEYEFYSSRSSGAGIRNYRWWKSVLDRIIAFLVCVTLAPFMAIIVFVIRLDSRGRAIFKREQIGENGRKFIAFKFRTMHANNDDNEYKKYLVKYIMENAPYRIGPEGNPVYKVDNDPRVTRFGALLRKTNMDELPQFFNVLKGEMSLVGPRPDIPFAVAMYKDWHLKRLSVKPGITGLWQVCRRKCLPFEGMVRLDLEYIKKQSLLLDIKIIFLTAVTIFKRDGSL